MLTVKEALRTELQGVLRDWHPFLARELGIDNEQDRQRIAEVDPHDAGKGGWLYGRILVDPTNCSNEENLSTDITFVINVEIVN